VVIAGAGPAGSVAAKKCAAAGLKCLLVEKAKPPRNKVCSGMLMGSIAQGIVRSEFGEIPGDVLVEPLRLKGYMIHYPGADNTAVEWPTPIGWRKDIDHWLNRRAIESGAAFRDETRVLAVEKTGRAFKVKLERRGKVEEAEAGYVIGADGANSAVRRSLYPELTVKYVQNYRECYRGAKISLEPGYFHAVFLPGAGLVYQAAHQKDGCLLLEMGAGMGKVKAQAERFREHLRKAYGLEPGLKPAWRDGCLTPSLLRGLVSREFQPAKGNVLLAGDAAGLLMPLTGEGIGWALKSGSQAAEAVIEASGKGGEAAGLYLNSFAGIMSQLDIILSKVKGLAGESARGPEHTAAALRECWETSLRLS
jgi:flavin-dependent dehydrogenase